MNYIFNIAYIELLAKIGTKSLTKVGINKINILKSCFKALL